MRVLHMGDTIGMGVYVGETVKDCLKKNGRKSILEILKYYDLDEDILKEYHYRYLGIHQDSPEDWNTKVLEVEETFVSTTTQDLDEEFFEPLEEEVVDDPWYCPVDYDPEDDDEFGNPWSPGYNKYKPWIYGY